MKARIGKFFPRLVCDLKFSHCPRKNIATNHPLSIFSTALLLCLFVAIVPFAKAQDVTENINAVVRHIDYPFGARITSSNDFEYSYYDNFPITLGDTIETANSGVEFEIPSIDLTARLGEESSLHLAQFVEGENGAMIPTFALERGSVRLLSSTALPIAARLTVATTTLEAGAVDIVVEYIPPDNYTIKTYKGSAVLIDSLLDETTLIEAGQELDYFDFDPISDIPPEEIGAVDSDRRLSDLAFQGAEIAGAAAVAAAAALSEEAERANELYDLLGDELDLGGAASIASRSSSTTDIEAFLDDSDLIAPPPVELSPGQQELVDLVNDPIWEILKVTGGIVPSGEDIYTTLSIRPGFTLENFEMRFNLTLSFTDEIADTDNWYTVAGSHEWSFGSTHFESNIIEGIFDLARDIFLKIDTIEVGSPDDIFFLRYGTLRDISFGHGILIDDYTTDTDRPLIRRQGLLMDIDIVFGSMRLLLPDLIEPEIAGIRFALHPFGDAFILGIGGLIDLAPIGIASNITQELIDNVLINPTLVPGAELSADEIAARTQQLGDFPLFFLPALIPLAIDLSFTPVATDSWTLEFYSEFALLLTIAPNFSLRNLASVASFLEQPLQVSSIINDRGDWIRNFATVTGVSNDLEMVEIDVELRSYTGILRPGLFDQSYARRRVSLGLQALQATLNPELTDFNVTGFGPYVGIGFNFLEDFINFGFGYFFPVELRDGELSLSNYDSIKLWGELAPGLLPFYIRFYYSRQGFLRTIIQEDIFDGASLFDGHSIYDLTIGYSPFGIVSFEIFLRDVVNISDTGYPEHENGVAVTNLQFGVVAYIGRR